MTMTGLLGGSDRPGFPRLYFTRVLDYYAEFRVEDIINTESVPTADRRLKRARSTFRGVPVRGE